MEVLERDPAAAVAAALPAGCGELGVTRVGARSVVTRACAASPLRLLLPRNQGPAAWIYTSTYGGGLLGGDRIALDIDVGPGASCFISTQASTKVYRSALRAEAGLTARVSSGGFLAIVPDPVVCFRASKFRQVQRIDLAGDSSLVFVDWVTSGRRAAGERWLFHEYSTRLEVRVGGRLVVYDATALRAEDIDVPARMGRFDVLGVVVMMGTRVRAAATELVAGLTGSTADLTRSAPEDVAAARNPDPADEIASAASVADGCVLRIAGTSVERAAATIRQWLDFLPGVLGDDPWARKW